MYIYLIYMNTYVHCCFQHLPLCFSNSFPLCILVCICAQFPLTMQFTLIKQRTRHQTHDIRAQTTHMQRTHSPHWPQYQARRFNSTRIEFQFAAFHSAANVIRNAAMPSHFIPFYLNAKSMRNLFTTHTPTNMRAYYFS